MNDWDDYSDFDYLDPSCPYDDIDDYFDYELDYDQYGPDTGSENSVSSSIGAAEKDNSEEKPISGFSLQRASLLSLAKYANVFMARCLEPGISFAQIDLINDLFAKICTNWPTASVCDFIKYLSPLALQSLCRQFDDPSVTGADELAKAANEAWIGHCLCRWRLQDYWQSEDWTSSVEDFKPLTKAKKKSWIEIFFKTFFKTLEYPNLRPTCSGNVDCPIICEYQLYQVCATGRACKQHKKQYRSTLPALKDCTYPTNKQVNFMNALRLSSRWLTKLDISRIPRTLIEPLSKIDDLQRNLKTLVTSDGMGGGEDSKIGSFVKAFPGVEVVAVHNHRIPMLYKQLTEEVAKNESQLCGLALRRIELRRDDAVNVTKLLKAMRFVECFELVSPIISDDDLATVLEGLRQATPSPNGVILLLKKRSFGKRSVGALQRLIDSSFGRHIQVLGLPAYTFWPAKPSRVDIQLYGYLNSTNFFGARRSGDLKSKSKPPLSLSSLQSSLQALELRFDHDFQEDIEALATFLETAKLVTLKLTFDGDVRLCDDFFKAMTHCANLRRLSLFADEISDEDLKKLSPAVIALERLDTLELFGYAIELDGLKNMASRLCTAGKRLELLSIQCKEIIEDNKNYYTRKYVKSSNHKYESMLHSLCDQVVSEVAVEFFGFNVTSTTFDYQYFDEL